MIEDWKKMSAETDDAWQHFENSVSHQRAKKVVSDSPGLVDFAIGLGNFVLTLPKGQMKFFVEFKLQKNCKINSAYQTVFGAS